MKTLKNKLTRLKYYDKAKKKKLRIISKHILSKCFNNLLMHNELQKWFLKDAQLDFIRALVRPQKGTFCNSIGRFLEAKRASLIFRCLIFYYKSPDKVMYFLCLNILLNNLFFITIYHYHKGM